MVRTRTALRHVHHVHRRTTQLGPDDGLRPVERDLFQLQRQVGNRAVSRYVTSQRERSPGVHIQRVLIDGGADLDQAQTKLASLPAPVEKKKGFFQKMKEGIGKFFGKRYKTAGQTQTENANWASGQIEDAKMQLAMLRVGIGGERIGDRRSRQSTGSEIIQILLRIQRTCEVLRDESPGAMGAVAEVVTACQQEIAAVKALTTGVDPIGVTDQSTWLEAIKYATGVEALNSGIREAAKDDTGQGLERLNRGNSGGQQLAYDTAGASLGNVISTMQGDMRMVISRFPSATQPKPSGEAPYSDVVEIVNGILAAVSPTLFPPNASYVTGDLQTLLQNTTRAAETSGGGKTVKQKGVDLAFWKIAGERAAVDVIFLRNIVPAITALSGEYSRSTNGGEAAFIAATLIQAAANKAAGGSNGALYGKGAAYEQMKTDRESFMAALLERTKSAVSNTSEREMAQV